MQCFFVGGHISTYDKVTWMVSSGRIYWQDGSVETPYPTPSTRILDHQLGPGTQVAQVNLCHHPNLQVPGTTLIRVVHNKLPLDL